MQKCLELSRLPKPSTRVKSIKFKRSTPGSVGNIVNSHRPPNPNRVLDPTHPALHLKASQFAKAFPWRVYPGFALRALPKGLLDKPSTPFPDPPFTQTPARSVTLVQENAQDVGASEGGGDSGGVDVDGAGEGATVRWAEAERGRISMSLVDVATKGIGSRVVHVGVLNKLKNAISLVVTRGADVEKGTDAIERIVFRDEQAGAHWVLRDWTYLCRPHPRLNRTPYTELIPAIRCALQDVHVPGQRLEDEWSTPAALQMSQLFASLGTLGDSTGGPSPNLVAKSAYLRKMLDKLAARHGTPDDDRWEVPPGHTFLEAMMARFRELLAEMKAKAAAAEARRSATGPKLAPSPNQTRTHGDAGPGPRRPTDLLSLAGREMIKARSSNHMPNRNVRGDDARYPRSRGDVAEHHPRINPRFVHHPPHRTLRSSLPRETSSSNHSGPGDA